MSSENEERILNMRINNKEFLKGTADSVSALDKLNKGINNTGKSGGGMQQLGKSAMDVKSKFSIMQVAGVTAVATIANKAVNAGLNMAKSFTIAPIMDGFREYEKLLTSTQTIMANTGKGANEVGKYLTELNKYSDQTIYNFGQMADNIGKFTAAGVKLKPAVAAIKGLANTAALSGSNTEQLNTAMYQMSQALASGTIKLMDWNSLVNAGMGGKNVQNALKMTARSIDGAGAAMDAAFKKGGNFRDSLRYGWLEADVFTKTMKVMAGTTKYANFSTQELADKGFNKAQIAAAQAGKSISYSVDALKDMGYSTEAAKKLSTLSQAAIDSATKVKTFSQLMEVLKESVGSGWAQIFGQLFGNLTEASAMWTKVSDVITNAVGKMFNRTTEMLKVWHNMENDDGLTGYKMLWLGIGNIFKSIGNIIKPFAQALMSLLPGVDEGGKTLFNLTEAFYQFTVWLEKATQNTSVLTPILYLLAGAIKFIIGAVAAWVGSMISLFKVFEPLLVAIGGLGKALIELVNGFIEMTGVAGGIGGAMSAAFGKFTEIRNGILTPFVTALTSVVKALTALVSGNIDFSDFKSMFADAFSGLGNNIGDLSSAGKQIAMDLISGLRNGIDGGAVIEVIKQVANDLINTFKSILGINSPSKVFEEFGANIMEGLSKGLSGAMSIISSVVSIIGSVLKALGNFFNFIAQQAASMDKLDWVNLFSIFMSGALLLGIRKIINGFSQFAGMFSGVTNVLSSAAGTFDQLTKGVKTMQNNVRSKTLLNIALSIGVLAASLLVLSMIPKEKLVTAIGAVASMLGLLVGSMLALSKVEGSISMTAVAASLVAMATAIGILSVAVAAFGLMPFDVIAKGFGSIALGMGLLVGSMLLLSKASPSIILGSSAMLIATAALGALSGVLIAYALIPWDTLISGIAKMGVVMGIMAAGMAALGSVSGMILVTSVSMGILAFALTGMLGVVAAYAAADWSTIVGGMAKIAAVIVTLGVVGAAAAPGITALGIAVGLLGLGVLAIGAGIALLGVGITAIAAGGVAAVGVLMVAFEGFLTLLPLFGLQVVAAFVAIVEALASASPRIVNAVVTMGGELLRGLRELSPQIINTAFTLISDFITALVGFTPQLVQAGIDILVQFIQGLSNNSGQLVAAGTKLITDFILGIGAAASGLVMVAGQAILSFLTAVNTAITVYMPQILEQGRLIGWNLLQGLVTGLVPAPILEAFSSLVSNVLNFFKNLLGINSPSTVFAEFGKNIIQGLINGIRGLIGGVISVLSSLVSRIVGFFSSIPGRAVSALSKLGGMLKNTFASAFAAAVSAVSSGVSKISSGISRIPGVISGVVGKVGSAAKSVGSSIISGIKSGLGKAVSAVGDLGSALKSGIKSAVNSALNLPLNIPKIHINLPGPKDIDFGGKQVIPRFAKGVTNYQGGSALVGEVGPELVTMNRGTNVITNKSLAGFMKSVHTLTAALSRGSSASADNANGTISYEVSADFKGDPKASGLAFASNIIAGLVNGLKSRQPEVNQLMSDTGADMSQSFADILGIASPSKVFETYAKFVGAGFIKGLLSSVSGVQAAALVMAKSATDTVSKTITDSQLTLESRSAKADAYAAAAALVRAKSNSKKYSKARRAAYAKQAKQLEKQAKKEANAAKALETKVTKENEAKERAQQYEKADTQGKADMRTEDAGTSAKEASELRERAIRLKTEANLVRKYDKARAKRLDELAAAALAASQKAATTATNYAKEAQTLAEQAKAEASKLEQEVIDAQVTSVSAQDVIDAQALFDQYAKLMLDTAEAAKTEANRSIEFTQNITSPEPLTPSEVYRQTDNLLSFTARNLPGASP